MLTRARIRTGVRSLTTPHPSDSVLHVAAMYQNTKALCSLLEAISGLKEELRLAMVDSPNADRQVGLGRS